jgi:hypothetical protein
MSDAKASSIAVCVVLDRSGSMSLRREPTRQAVNDYVTGLRKDPATADAVLSLLIFDTGSIDVLRQRVPAKRRVRATRRHASL